MYALCATVVFCPLLASADEAPDFLIINAGRHVIISVTISPSTAVGAAPDSIGSEQISFGHTGNWGTDSLESERLAPGQYVRLLRGKKLSTCFQDVQVVWDDGARSDTNNFNVCTTNLTLHY